MVKTKKARGSTSATVPAGAGKSSSAAAGPIPQPTRLTPGGKLKRPPGLKFAGRNPVTGKAIPHTRDEKVAAKVLELCGFGLDENEIALHLNLRPGQLRQHYADELKRGALETTIDVIRTAKAMATSGLNDTMTRFWLECREGWIRSERREHTGEGGGPMRSVVTYLPDNGRRNAPASSA